MNLASTVIRCAPRKRRAAARPLTRLALLTATTAVVGWLIHLTRHLP